MPGRASQLDQAAAITRVVQIAPLAADFRQQVAKILESAAFKGSRRSQDFLKHIVAQALDGHFDALKERTLGVEIFGRNPSYDTGDDAIVRVTASDVRRRLHQFYGGEAASSEWRIDLPAGSYIPEFHRVHSAAETVPAASALLPEKQPLGWRRIRGLPYAVGALMICFGVWLGIRSGSTEQLRPEKVLPWSAILQTNREVRIILCDPDISILQNLLDFNISLSDYANKRFLPDSPAAEQPTAREFARRLRGVNVASVDAALAINISELAVRGGKHVRTQNARSLQMSDFKTEDNFVVLGSPRSNPWSTLFERALHFKFEYDEIAKQEIIANAHVNSGELARYVPTAKGWGTGQAYGVIALVTNPGQSGHVLLLAGTNAEATEAAGKLATNLSLLSRTLKQHGVDGGGSSQPFEMLLRVGTMAGSANTFEVVACHRLTEK